MYENISDWYFKALQLAKNSKLTDFLQHLKLTNPKDAAKFDELAILWTNKYHSVIKSSHKDHYAALKIYYFCVHREGSFDFLNLLTKHTENAENLLEYILLSDKENNYQDLGDTIDKAIDKFPNDYKIHGDTPTILSSSTITKPAQSIEKQEVHDIETIMFPFLRVTPPRHLFSFNIKQEYLQCILITQLFGEMCKEVLNMGFAEAWEYCDSKFVMPHFAARLSSVSK